MKTKNILLLIFSLITISTFAQNQESEVVKSRTAVTEFKVKTENLDELKNFDWNRVKETFQENDAEQEITLAFAYVNKSKIVKSNTRLENFEMTLTGKTADLEKLTEKLKKAIDELDENGQYNKN